jgi:hypothetical protein
MQDIPEKISQISFPSSLNSIAIQTESEDAVAKLLIALLSSRGVEVDLKSKEHDVSDEVIVHNPFKRALGLGKKKRNSVTINVDKDLKRFDKPSKLPHIFTNQRQSDFPTDKQKAILLKLKKVPIYAVVNRYNEIIIATPRDRPPKNTMEWLSDKYHLNFLWKRDEGSVNLNLFFMNHEDADTYMQEVAKADPRGALTHSLRVRNVGLDTFYEFNRTSKPKHQARLIADLQEVDFILNDGYINKSTTFHPKQKHKKTWLQGVPIYKMRVTDARELLKPYMAKIKIKTLARYRPLDGVDPVACATSVYTFTREDAYRVWEKYRVSQPYVRLPKQPILEVYNIESYLLDLEQSDILLTEKTLFIPHYEAFQYNEYASKKLAARIAYFTGPTTWENVDERRNFKVRIIKRLFVDRIIPSLKRFYKGIIWVLNSDTLPTEEGAW